MAKTTCDYCGKPPFRYCGVCAHENGFGRLDDAQWRVFAQHVRGKVVVDLGAGNCGLAERAASVAKRVVAIDSDHLSSSRFAAVKAAGIEYHQARFEDVAVNLERYAPPGAVAVVSWPWADLSHEQALVSILARTGRVLYVGKNTDGTACGGVRLFEHFLRRKLLAHVSRKRNTLLVLGKATRSLRPPTGEELGGLSPHPIAYEIATQVNGVLTLPGT